MVGLFSMVLVWVREMDVVGLSTMVLDVWLGSDPDDVDTGETLGEAATNTSIDPDTVTGASGGVGTNPVAGGGDVPNHSNNVSDTETEFKLPKLAFLVNWLEEPVLLSSAC